LFPCTTPRRKHLRGKTAADNVLRGTHWVRSATFPPFRSSRARSRRSEAAPACHLGQPHTKAAAGKLIFLLAKINRVELAGGRDGEDDAERGEV